MTDSAFLIDVKGLNGLERALSRYPEIAKPYLQKAFDASGAVMAKHTLKNDPVPWKTGNLLQSFRYMSGNLSARWFPTAKYAPFVELGTSPHRIMPRSKKALAWEQGGGGRYVTSASGRRYYRKAKGTKVVVAYVDHPGTKAKPFMGKIVNRAKDDVRDVFAEASDLVHAEIARQTK